MAVPACLSASCAVPLGVTIVTTSGVESSGDQEARPFAGRSVEPSWAGGFDGQYARSGRLRHGRRTVRGEERRRTTFRVSGRGEPRSETFALVNLDGLGISRGFRARATTRVADTE